MTLLRSQYIVLSALLVVGAGCNQKATVESARTANLTPKPIHTMKSLCKSLLSGEDLATQTLLDLVSEINPHNSEPYNGKNSDCYEAAIHALTTHK